MDHDSLRPWPSREEIGRLMGWPQRMWTQAMRDMPSMELAEDGNDLVVRLEVPGVEPDELDIEVSSHQISVRGEIRQREDGHGEIYHTERHYGRFQRSVSLPVAVDADRATADFHQGLLEIRLPRQDGDRRRLTIKGAGGSGRH